MDELTHQYLLELLDYDPETGHLTYKKRPSRKIHIGTRAGSNGNNGYRSIHLLGKSYPEHRIIWYWVHGSFPKGHIDHINHVRDDNRISNLREVTISENARNRKRNLKSRTGEVGIWYNKRTKKYIAQIRVNGKKVFQKAFDDVDDAIKARKERARELGFHENHGE